MDQKKLLSLAIVVTMLTSVIYTIVSYRYGIDLESSPTVLGQYGGGGGGGGSPGLPSADLIRYVTRRQAYNMIKVLSPSDAAKVLKDVQNNIILEIFEFYSDPIALMVIIQEMEPAKAGSLILDMDALESGTLTYEIFSLIKTRHSNIVDYMLSANLQGSAVIVENTVKYLVEGIEEEDKYLAIVDIAETLNLFTAERLEQLFHKIANFPETPSTVAYLMESMIPQHVVDIFNIWISFQEFETIVNVLDYITTPTLGEIYISIGGENRVELYPYLTEDLISDLPQIGFFQASQLTVRPLTVEPGNPVRISFTLENTQEEADDYAVYVKVNGEIEQVFSGIMEESSEDFELSVTKYVEGIYQVEVDSETASFNVEVPIPLRPAEFEIEDVLIIPEEVFIGEDVQVFVMVSNVGEEEGLNTVELLIDNTVLDFISTLILPGETITVNFDFPADLGVGEHIAQVEDTIIGFTIIEPQSTRPILTIFVMTLVGIGYMIYWLYENDYLEQWGLLGIVQRFLD